jgi:hypothetical protein
MHTKAIARIRCALILVPLLAFMSLAACTNALQDIAKAEAAIPQAVTIVANTSTQLVNTGAMTPEEGGKVATILTDVINANVRAVAATKAIASLDPTSKATISQIVNPIIAEIQGAVTTGDVAQIKNPTAKIAITTALSALSTTLAIIQAKVI